jgi:hypothetical protein
MRAALFGVLSQRVVVISGKTVDPIVKGQESKKKEYCLDFLPIKMGPTGCPETSIGNYRYSPHKSPEERIFQRTES